MHDARTYVAPFMNAGNIVTIAPLNTIAPECSTTDSGAMRQAFDSSAAYIARMKCVWQMPFGIPVVPLVYITVSRSPASTCAHGGASEAASRSVAYESQPRPRPRAPDRRVPMPAAVARRHRA